MPHCFSTLHTTRPSIIMLLQLATKQGSATPAMLLAAKGLSAVRAAAYSNSAAASSAALDAASSSTSSLAVCMHGQTAVLELNRPKQINALSTQVLQVCSISTPACVCVLSQPMACTHTRTGHA